MAPWQVTHVANADGAYDVVLIPLVAAEPLDPKAVAGARSQTGARRKAAQSPPRRATNAETQQKPPSALRQLDF
jgi:hypothetical protein